MVLDGETSLDNGNREGSVAGRFASRLMESALEIDRARIGDGPIGDVLKANLDIWIALRTALSGDRDALNPDTRTNIDRLSRFVSEKTFAGADGMVDSELDTLVFINLQIAEGLLEGENA